MGAVGNVLGILAILVGRIPTPGVAQVALDFSSVAVVIVAIFAGWRLGALTGLIAGIGPMILFGYVYGSTGLITILLPAGKALTGFFVGFIAQLVGSTRRIRAPYVLGAILLGFIPEAVLTWFYFVNLVPLFVQGGGYWAPALALPVLVKAWAEMTIIAFLTIALFRNAGFRSFLVRIVPNQNF
jgi:hypothetical protein